MERGFSLLEIAVVLVIVGLVFAGVIGPLSVRLEQEQRAKTRVLLDEIKHALLGFAAINGRLPCPTTQNIPGAANYGEEDSICGPSDPTIEGILPWKTLGVSPRDAWGRERVDLGDLWNGYWRYRVDRNFADRFNPITFATAPSADALSVEDASNNALTTTTPTGRPIAIVFSAGANLVPDGENSIFEPSTGIYEAGEYSTVFDDITTWLSPPLVFDRMIAAGQLP